ncbi:TSUP family transporter [Desulfovibrio sp. OttesenSCG-928-G15]|nr:TSUP family transporter [Desulfovibrio sp. OttesenSCG-928-G15]
MEWIDPLHLGLAGLCIVTVAAFFAGFVDSVAGGGGLISLPAALLAGLPPHLALGTGKFMASLGTTASFLTYARHKAILWKVAAIGSPFSFAGSALGSQAALWLDNAVLGKIILCLLPVAALLTFMPIREGHREKDSNPVALWVLTPVICSAIGFYDGFFGPGTGSFFLLCLHFFLGLNLIAATGTAKAFNLASNLSSLGIFLVNAKIYYFVAIPMALANIAGNVCGSKMALRGGPKVIKRMLLLSLLLLFASLVWRYFA